MTAGLLFNKTVSPWLSMSGFSLFPADPGGDAREIARGVDLKGLSWLPDGSGVVYSSPAGSTVLYPPLFNLRAVGRDGGGNRQLTFGDVSYVEPDVHVVRPRDREPDPDAIGHLEISCRWVAGRQHATRLQITRQTGQAQTPSVSPDESEVVYLSDSGGHGNLWIARTDGSSVRQITFKQDPATSVGVPVWSPTGDRIVFILTRAGMTGLSLINRDGSGLRPLVAAGYSAAWSADGQWVYYSRDSGDTVCTEKTAIEGGPAISIRCGTPTLQLRRLTARRCISGSYLIKTNGTVDYEFRRAQPENNPASDVLARVAGSRAPVSRRVLIPVLSPDGQWLTMPLSDGTTSNIWVLPTNGKAMRPLTDFGERSVVIGRRVSWSRDSKYVYAAVAEADAGHRPAQRPAQRARFNRTLINVQQCDAIATRGAHLASLAAIAGSR